MAFIPKESPLDGRTMLQAGRAGGRPLTLSNTSQKNVARAASVTLAMYAEASAHEVQHGFVRGRRLLENRLDMDCTLIAASMGGAAKCGVALFDVAAAFPSLQWRWIFLALRRLGVPPWLRKLVRGLLLSGAAPLSRLAALPLLPRC